MIKIAVIIVNYNSARYLKRAVKCLSEQTRLPDQVIIYDNASAEPIPAELESTGLNLTIVQGPENLGFAGGNNRALEALNADITWLALLNPDAYPTNEWLSVMENAIKDYPHYSFLGSKLIWDEHPNRFDGTGDAYHISGKAWRMNHQKPIQCDNQIKEVFSPCAAAALYRRDIFEQVGGFDERFFCYYEDTDLAFRLRLLGYRCAYIPQAIVYHTGSATTTRHSDFYTYYGHRNLVWTYVKNMPTVLLVLFLPMHIALNLASLLVFAYRGQFKTIWRAKKDAIKGLTAIRKHRQQWQKQRSVSLKQLLQSFHKGWPA